MIRWKMYRKASKEVNELIMIANITFVMAGILLIVDNYTDEVSNIDNVLELIILGFLLCFFTTSNLYRNYLHDIIFKRIEVCNACIHAQQKFITQDELHSLFGSKKNIGKKQFRLWTQEVDEHGNLKPYECTCDSWHIYPNGNEFMSFDFKLYEELEEMIGKIPERRIEENGKRYRLEKEQLLYVELSYFKSTNLIFDVKVLGKKNTKEM